MGMAFSAMIAMITTQQKEGKAIHQKLGKGATKFAILQTLYNPENCLCQFNPPLVTPPHTIDTTKTDPADQGFEIDLGKFRSGCGGGDENILAESGKKIKGTNGLTTGTVKVIEIKSTGTTNEYVGDLTISFQIQDNMIAHQNLIVPMIFTVDSSDPSSRPEARPIVSCGMYDRDSGLLIRVTDLENLNIDTEDQLVQLQERIKNLEDSSLQCTPSRTIAMDGVTDLGQCPSGQQCQSKTISYNVVDPSDKTKCQLQSTQIGCARCVPRPALPPDTTEPKRICKIWVHNECLEYVTPF